MRPIVNVSPLLIACARAGKPLPAKTLLLTPISGAPGDRQQSGHAKGDRSGETTPVLKMRQPEVECGGITSA